MRGRRLLLLPVVTAFIFTQISILLNPTVVQAGTIKGKWVDRSTIDVNGNNFVDDKIDDDNTFVEQANCASGGKSSNIKLQDGMLLQASDYNHGTLTNCDGSTTQVDLSDKAYLANFYIAFKWVNSAEIDSIYGGSRDDAKISTPNIYARASANSFEVTTDDNGCKDLISNISSDHSKASLTAKTQQRGNNGAPTRYNDYWPFGLASGSPNFSHFEGNCAVYDAVTIYLSNTDKASAAPPDQSVADNGLGTASCGGFDLTWIICSTINVAAQTTNAIDGEVTKYLTLAPLTTTANGVADPRYTLWSKFRDLADAAFVLVFIGIIFANVLSIEAYMVKKILPRLVAAVILVQFSFVIAQLAIDTTNIIGQGLLDIGSSVLNGLPEPQALQSLANNAPSTLKSVGTGAAIGAGVLVTGIIAHGFSNAMGALVLIFVIPAFFAIIGILITVAFRSILVALCTVFAPLAFVAWILPNTEGMFTLWRKTFMKVLLMFPLIIMLIIIGKMVALTAGFAVQSIAPIDPNQKIDLSNGQTIGILWVLGGLIVPLLMIPATFKFSGGMIGMVGGFITGFAARGGKISAKGAGSIGGGLRGGINKRGARMAATGGNSVSRVTGRVMSGSLFRANELAKTYESDYKERKAAATRRVRIMERVDQDKVRQWAEGGLGVKPEQQEAALESLIRNQSMFENKSAPNDPRNGELILRQVLQNPKSGVLKSAAWNEVKSQNFTAIKELGPDLVAASQPDEIGSFKAFTPTDFLKMHPSTVKAVTLNATSKANLESAITTLLNDKRTYERVSGSKQLKAAVDALGGTNNLNKAVNPIFRTSTGVYVDGDGIIHT